MHQIENLKSISNRIRENKRVDLCEVSKALDSAIALLNSSAQQSALASRSASNQTLVAEANKQIESLKSERDSFKRKFDDTRQDLSALEPVATSLRQELAGKVSLLSFSKERKNALTTAIKSTSISNLVSQLKPEIEDHFSREFTPQPGGSFQAGVAIRPPNFNLYKQGS
jgi:chromosome segregation ATPase